ncbi:hypothetical protein BDV12DRAFT_30821 [Aspergillus spectabilis]
MRWTGRPSMSPREFPGQGLLTTVDGATPSMMACGFLFQARNPQLSFDIVSFLLLRGADPRPADASGMTVTHYALIRPYPPLIKLLIDAGCPLDTPDQQGRLPIHLLAMGVGRLMWDLRLADYIVPDILCTTAGMILEAAYSDASASMLDVGIRKALRTTQRVNC